MLSPPKFITLAQYSQVNCLLLFNVVYLGKLNYILASHYTLSNLSILPISLSHRVFGIFHLLTQASFDDRSTRDTDHDSSITTIKGQDCKTNKAD